MRRMLSEEFIDAGPRVVRQDDLGYHIRWDGDRVYSPKLGPYFGQKVHVVSCLSGTAYTISEWRDPAWKHPGGWITRSGAIIDHNIPRPSDRVVEGYK